MDARVAEVKESLAERVMTFEQMHEIHELPEVKRRINALKALQFKKLEADGELHKEILRLIESKVSPKFEELFRRRNDIINGNTEPNEEEWKEYSEDCEKKVESITKPTVEGIPGFWARVFLNCKATGQLISKKDFAVLLHLKDIVATKNAEPAKLVLEFRFKENPYFENEVLTKEYELEHKPDPKFFHDTNSWFVTKRKGCSINWKKGKKLTEVREHKSFDDLEEKSFFYFFDPPEDPENHSKADSELLDDLAEDWELGLAISENIVQNAVLYFVFDHFADESRESEESEDLDDIEEEEEDDDDDDDESVEEVNETQLWKKLMEKQTNLPQFSKPS